MIAVNVVKYQRLTHRDCCEITLTNNNGGTVTILNYGATLEKFIVPDHQGKFINMVLSLSKASYYSKERNFLGGTVGRIIGRMSDGKWTFGKNSYQFNNNDGKNHAHGGVEGFDTQVFDFKIVQKEKSASVVLTLFDYAGHNGYPGNVKVQVTYTFTEENTLIYQISAITDDITLFNPGNHSYFNLDGKGRILNQNLLIDASRYLPLNNNSIPDMGYMSVEDTVFDFRSGKLIKSAIASQDKQIIKQNGLNHPFLLDGHNVAAILTSSDEQRRMLMKTTAPSIVVYTANHFNHSGYANNIGQYDGVALEAQLPPTDDPMLQSITLLPGERFESETSWHMDY